MTPEQIAAELVEVRSYTNGYAVVFGTGFYRYHQTCIDAPAADALVECLIELVVEGIRRSRPPACTDCGAPGATTCLVCMESQDRWLWRIGRC